MRGFVFFRLEENGVLTDASIKTLESDEVLDFNFTSSNVLNKIIMKVSYPANNPPPSPSSPLSLLCCQVTGLSRFLPPQSYPLLSPIPFMLPSNWFFTIFVVRVFKGSI